MCLFGALTHVGATALKGHFRDAHLYWGRTRKPRLELLNSHNVYLRSGESESPHLRPEFLFTGLAHRAVTTWTGMHIPQSDVIAAAMRAQPPNIATKRRSHITNDSTHNDIPDALTVRTRHSMNLLPEQPASFISLSLISARRASISLLPRHRQTVNLIS